MTTLQFAELMIEDFWPIWASGILAIVLGTFLGRRYRQVRYKARR